MWRAFSHSPDLQNAWPTSHGLLPPTAFSPLLKLGYHHSVPSAVTSPPETVRRKRGRPRKYGTSEQALSAKKASSSSPMSKKKEQGLASSSKSSQLLSLEKHRELEKLAEEQAERERQAEEQRRTEAEKAGREADRAQAREETERRREMLQHLMKKAAVSVDDVWFIEPRKFTGWVVYCWKPHQG